MTRDAELDDYQFICGIGVLTKLPIDDRLEAIFHIFDEDRTQICEEIEIRQMISTLFTILNGKKFTEEQIYKKLDGLKSAFFLRANYITLYEFINICKMDTEIRKILGNLGVFAPHEFDIKVPDYDLDTEMRKQENNDREAFYLSMKLGLTTPEDEPMSLEKGFTFTSVEKDPNLKPWEALEAVSAPTGFTEDSQNADFPNSILRLHYAYGIRSYDTRNNLFFNSKGNLLYHTAELAVILDLENNSQEFITENQDDILCMDTWKNLTATGDVGDIPILVIWDNEKLVVLAKHVGTLRKGINLMSFSQDGKWLAVNTIDADNTITIFDMTSLLENKPESKS
jgi:hypothetical protein